MSSADRTSLSEAAAYPGPHPASSSAVAPLPLPAPAPPPPQQQQQQQPQVKAAPKSAGGPADRFSTADRAILEELKAGIRAREAQFTLKGVGHTVLGGGKGPGKRHHAYPKEEVPYPRAYAREVIDLCVFFSLSFSLVGLFPRSALCCILLLCRGFRCCPNPSIPFARLRLTRPREATEGRWCAGYASDSRG